VVALIMSSPGNLAHQLSDLQGGMLALLCSCTPLLLYTVS
jgi:hypothetical protein